MEILNKKIVVVGLGKSGLSAARWLSRERAVVTVSEVKRETELDPGVAKEMSDRGVTLETGGHRVETFLNSDMIIVSPGVPLDIEPLRVARGTGIPILGEMELACRLIDAPVVAVTGTNGKSTVTAFLGSMIEDAGFRVFVGGNIGTPLMDYVAEGQKADYVVVEVSSFQLDTMETFSPRVALLLNVSPDHLDRYPSYEAYVQSKLRIFQSQGRDQFAIINDDDETLSRIQFSREVAVLRYGMERRNHRQAYVEGRRLIASLRGMGPFDFDLSQFSLPGRHNLENLMGGVLAGLALGIAPPIIQKTIDLFRALPHRLELVGRIGGVAFYDDSKATNVDAALRSVLSFDRPVILIAGGRHKGGDYAPLVEAAKGGVRKAVFLGESRSLLAKSFEGSIPFVLAKDMKDAVTQAFLSAQSDDVVLLAPACSSFDMFSDYAERGMVFRKAVESLRDGT